LSDAPLYTSLTTLSSSVSINSLLQQLRNKLLDDERDFNSGRNNFSNTNTNGSNSTSTSSTSRKTILCCIALHEEAYIDEFVDYHLGIGFLKVIVYDNSDHYEMKQWGDKRNRRVKLRTTESSDGTTTNNSSVVSESDGTNNNKVHVLHYPGRGKQGASYLDCARRAYHGDFGDGIEYAAFWDIDEFLILKQHTTVDELLEEYMINKGASSLSINWHMFRHGNRNVYEPLPVTKRFLLRNREVQYQVKSMVYLEDMDMTKENHPHYPHLKNGTIRIDTNGTQLTKMWNNNGPNNIAILHHYKTKSYAEYIKKRERGRAAVADWNPVDRHSGYEKNRKEALDEYVEAMRKYNYTSSSIFYDDGSVEDADNDEDDNDQPVYDDTAWTAIKRVCPKYVLYDLLDEI
jgi:hypothetical protein